MPNPPIPSLVAHRGYLRQYPENTWLALQAALDAGACWLEFDVQMCADCQFVLLHDAGLGRTADVEMDALTTPSHQLTASVHEPQRFGDRFAPTPITPLSEALRRLARWPRARAMVEIKQESLAHHGLDVVMRRLLPLLQAHAEQCVLISYDLPALVWSRRHCTLPVGWVLTRYDETRLAQARQLAPDFLICNERKLPPQQPPWPGPWQWMLYDIVDPQQALEWAARGVSLIETADIGAMLRHPRLAPGACHRAGL